MRKYKIHHCLAVELGRWEGGWEEKRESALYEKRIKKNDKNKNLDFFLKKKHLGKMLSEFQTETQAFGVIKVPLAKKSEYLRGT